MGTRCLHAVYSDGQAPSRRYRPATQPAIPLYSTRHHLGRFFRIVSFSASERVVNSSNVNPPTHSRFLIHWPSGGIAPISGISSQALFGYSKHRHWPHHAAPNNRDRLPHRKPFVSSISITRSPKPVQTAPCCSPLPFQLSTRHGRTSF